MTGGDDGGLLARLVQSFPGMAYRCLHDADWTLDFASEGCLELLGYTVDELVTARLVAISDLVHPDDLSMVSLGVERALSDHAPFYLQYRMRTREGAYKWISEVGRGDFDADGNLVAIEGFLCDVTAEVEAREAAKSSERREVVARMASGIAHDFNNIIMAVQVSAEAARRHLAAGDHASVSEELAAVGGLAERARALTKQLLTFGSPRAMKSDPIDLVDRIRSLRTMLVHIIGKAELVVTLPPGALRCRIDPVQLEQVIANLVVNARDAMPGGGRITLTLEEDDERGALFTVSDDGSGISADTLAHVFDPYFSTKGEGGTGLGLATVRSIVEAASGSISIESKLGEGTTIRFNLPLVDSAPTTQNFGTEVILLADDQVEVRRAVARGLRRLGYTVLEAADGEQALKISERHKGPLDLLLADGRMPKMNGIDLAATLLVARPSLVAILMTGDSVKTPPTFADTVRKPATISGDRSCRSTLVGRAQKTEPGPVATY